MAAAAALRVLIFHSSANFFKRVLLKVFGLFCAFLGILLFLHDFGHFLHIFCVLIFQTQSFACAIL